MASPNRRGRPRRVDNSHPKNPVLQSEHGLVTRFKRLQRCWGRCQVQIIISSNCFTRSFQFQSVGLVSSENLVSPSFPQTRQAGNSRRMAVLVWHSPILFAVLEPLPFGSLRTLPAMASFAFEAMAYCSVRSFWLKNLISSSLHIMFHYNCCFHN